MPEFGKTSRERLETCHPNLQIIMNDVVKIFDITILQGHRTPEEHAKYLKEGRTKVEYQDSKHSRNPSLAVDIAPWPIPRDWGEHSFKGLARFYYMAGIVKGIAQSRNIKIRWGGDWNGNNIFTDQKFDDLVHFELIGVQS